MTAGLGGLAAVALGGAIGASLRYLVALAAGEWLGRAFPWGTLTVNVTGSLLIGYLLIALPDGRGDATLLRLWLVTGVLGGFTTFSAFSLESLQLALDGHLARAAVNVVVTLAGCLGGAFIGFAFARWIHGPA